MLRALTSLFFTTLPLATLGYLIPSTAKAQIAVDGTTSTTVNQNGNNFTIEQGDRLGDNLFHSFNEFSVPTSGSALFNNPADIANIFSRVTGNNISNIDGLISANGAANLFLINPNGIIFGENASLNLGGSFFASTADSLLFDEDTEFSATNPQAPPLLKVNIPIGLNFQDNPGEIVNRSMVKNSAGDSVGLEVAPGKNLTIVGGDINFDAGNTTVRGGNIQLGGLSAAGIVGINQDGSLNFAEDLAQADITLSNAADVDVLGTGGGSITINARNLNLEAGDLGRSFIRGGINADSTSANAQAGDITINATDNISIDNSLIGNGVRPEAVGNSGDVNISTDSLTLTNGAGIGTVTSGRGNAGAIAINATDTIALDGTNLEGDGISSIVSQVNPSGIGDAGGIEINTANLSLTNGAQISGIVFGKGAGGLVLINAADELSLDSSFILANLEADATGKAGDLEITTTNLNLTNGSGITANTRGIGDAGQISLDVASTISAEGSGISSNVEGENSQGNAGGIEINTANLSLTNDAQISSSVGGKGTGGLVSINAADEISLDNSSILANLEADATGKAGDLEITTTNLNLTNGSEITAVTRGIGDAGQISLDVGENISAEGGGIFSTVEGENSQGNAGGIEIDTANLSLTNSAVISAITDGQGNAGSIAINATDTIALDGTNPQGDNISSIVSQVNPSGIGDAGGIEINTANLSLTNGAQISGIVFGKGAGGLVLINAADELSLDSSFILANLEADATGKAGDLEITTTNLNLTNGSEITAVTRGIGDAGQISLDVGENISAEGGGIFSTVEGENSQGNAGGIEIDTANLSLTNSAVISAITDGQGNAGSIAINATDTIALDGTNPQGDNISSIVSQVNPSGIGDAGGIEINTANLSLTNGAEISSDVLGKGNGGLVSINATDEISLDDGSIFANLGVDATGKAGDIDITTTNLNLTNGSAIAAATLGIGDAGQISLDVAATISAEGGGIFSSVLGENSQGNAGGIEIDTANLSLTNSAVISAITDGQGNAGSIAINATDTIALDGTNPQGDNISSIVSQVNPSGIGDAKGIEINTANLSLTDGAQISGGVLGKGNGGLVSINVTDKLSLDSSAILANLEADATGKAGDLEITTTNLNLTNGSGITANTRGIGDAGQISLDVASTISAEGSGISSNVEGENSQGNAGGIEIDTANLSLTDGAAISGSVFGKGTGGLVSINAETISAKNGGIFSSVIGETIQNNTVGGIKINTANLFLTNGGVVSTIIEGGGNAGNITVNARESIFISGVNENNFSSGIAASALTVNGIAGNVDIFTNQLTIEDGAGISVSSSEGLAGNISITANSLSQNGGRITSETRLNDEDTGANIDLQIADLWLLENESLVSATAFGIADGGNINIDTKFIVAFPNQNNDIIANAEQGIGGNINITAESLFGLAARSSTPPNSTNDIDASSEFGLDGDISIDTPNVDPTRGLENLPTDIVDASRLITRTCLGGGDSDELNEFVVTGRGGLPSNPSESLPGDATLSAEWLSLPETTKDSRELSTKEDSSQGKKSISMPQIVEAQGWMINADGNVVLTATANTPQLSIPWLVPNACSNF